MSALHAFPGGLCLPANKERSTALPIQQAPLAQRYIVPLGQHIGAPARPCVEVGQAVLKGQTIALPDGTVSAALHAPTSGTVVAIGAHPYPHASGLPAPAIVIASDGLERWTELHPCRTSAPKVRWRCSNASARPASAVSAAPASPPRPSSPRARRKRSIRWW